jgi:protein tyrosine/serine phosphatase
MTHMVETLDSTVEGAINFRDIGGYRGAGGRPVRMGRIYRSAMTHHITAAGLTALRGRVGIRMVLDLRNAEELEQDGVAPFAEHGIGYRNAPVGAETVMTPEQRAERMLRIATGDVDWGEMYAQMTGRESGAFRALFELAATDQHTPLVFHCTGGRDRTGVAAALLLSVLGVADGDIANDYALTGALLRPHVHRFRRHIEMFGMDEDRWTKLVDTDGDAMLQYLARLRREHGSPEAYVRTIGVSEETLAAVRGSSLEA